MIGYTSFELDCSKNSSKSIAIIYTGGTFGMRMDPSTQTLIPFEFERIVELMPELSKLDIKLTIFTFNELLDSPNIKPDHWVCLANIIYSNHHIFDGFVILHGTDTMAYTASALSFMLLGLKKPVILTGAQLPLGMPRNDARENLITALEIISSQQNLQKRISEVCIYFQNLLLRGNRSTKVESVYFDAFSSENHPHLAKAGINIEYNYNAFLTPMDELQRYEKIETNVAILPLFPGIEERYIKAIVDSGIKSLVLETYGSGNAPTDKWFLDVISKKINEGCLILNISQCAGGKVIHGKYRTSQLLADAGVISGNDITREAAITKLMTLIPYNTPSELSIKLSKSICGEMNT